MKLLITTLTMIFISFGAHAFNVETLYKYCKPYQNNGFSWDNLSKSKIQDGIICISYFRGLGEAGYGTCDYFRRVYDRGLIDIKAFKTLSSLTANEKFGSVTQIITSFINFAENNPQHWKYSPYNYTNKYISEKFPCKLDK